jgi:phosphoribosylformimino-5-aminoimidazole carboxamide ribotide isomerase
MIRCILACDLMGGVVVRGVRGERDRYRPISEYSQVVDTPAPEDVIRTLRPRETYIADLDRITGKGDSLRVIEGISKLTRTMTDAGVADRPGFEAVRAVSRSVILGTETASLSLIEACQGRDVVVSVDGSLGIPAPGDRRRRGQGHGRPRSHQRGRRGRRHRGLCGPLRPDTS